MTLESAMLLVCGAVLLLLALVLIVASRGVRRMVERAMGGAREELEARQNELQEAQAVLGKRISALKSGADELRGSVEKTAESVAGTVATVKAQEEALNARLAEQRSEAEARLAELKAEVESRLKGLADSQGGAATERARLSDRVAELEGLLGTVRDEFKVQAERVEGLRNYLENTFQRDLKGAMRSFDDTVSSVLGEMKDELLVGVRRIEQLESAVINRRDAQHRISERSSREVQQLLDAGPESAEESSVPDASADDSETNAGEEGAAAGSGDGVKFTGAPKVPPVSRPEGGGNGREAATPPDDSVDPSEAETRIGGIAAANAANGEDIPKKNVTLEDISKIVAGKKSGDDWSADAD